MELTIPFGDASITARAPDNTFVLPTGGTTKSPPAIGDLDGAIRQALAKPLGSPPVKALAKSGSRVTIAFDDGTVPCFGPYRRLAIAALLEELDAAGVARENIRLICANALHRKFRSDELRLFLGNDLVDGFGPRLTCHDAEDPENLVHLGKTDTHGLDVEVHRAVVESDLTIYVNSSHGRGFAGGWKSICVGLSTFRSIRHHHTPDGMSMSVRDNRMHRVLDEMGAHLESKIPGRIFKVDAIERNPFEKTNIFAGSVGASRAAALDVLEAQFPPRRSLSNDKFDVVLYGVPNWSPYAIFSHMNPILTLISSGLGYLGGTIQALGNPGCTVIMATPCPEQWDRVHHPSYPDVWENVLPFEKDPYAIEKAYTDKYAHHPEYIDMYRNRFAFHPVHGIFATQPLKRLRHAGKVIVAGIENPALARQLGFEPASSVEEALALAQGIHGAGYSLVYAQHPAAQTKVAM